MSKLKSDKLIILDLDETLFHADILDMDDFDYTFTLKDDNRTSQFYTIKRPYLDEFIEYIKDNFEYGIFTSSSQDYASKQCEILGLDDYKFLLHRENCTVKPMMMENEWGEPEPFSMGNVYYLKKLSKLKKYSDLSKMIAIDDKPESFKENFGNLIKVNPFHYDKKDTTLLKLMGFLEDLKDVDNIRKIEKRGWMDKY